MRIILLLVLFTCIGRNEGLRMKNQSHTNQLFYCDDKLASLHLRDDESHRLFGAARIQLAESYKSSSANSTRITATNQAGSALNYIAKDKLLDYCPYGFHLDSDLNNSRIMFNGELLATLDLYLLGNGYRAYNTSLRRFHSPDSMSPFGFGGLNAYGYCENDPINNIDPSGHHLVPWGIRKQFRSTQGLNRHYEKIINSRSRDLKMRMSYVIYGQPKYSKVTEKMKRTVPTEAQYYDISDRFAKYNETIVQDSISIGGTVGKLKPGHDSGLSLSMPPTELVKTYDAYSPDLLEYAELTKNINRIRKLERHLANQQLMHFKTAANRNTSRNARGWDNVIPAGNSATRTRRYNELHR